MNRARNDLLTGSRLAGYQHGQIGRGDAAVQLHSFHESHADADEIDIGGVDRRLRQFIADALAGSLFNAAAHRLRYSLDVFYLKRLHQVVIGPRRDRIERADGRSVAGHQNDLCFRAFVGEAAQHLITFVIVLGAEPNIAEHQRPGIAVQKLEGLFGRLSLGDLPALAAQYLSNIAADQVVVIYYQGFHYLQDCLTHLDLCPPLRFVKDWSASV